MDDGVVEMRFTVEYPVDGPGHDPALLRPRSVTTLVQAAERLGFDAVAFTEHPAPSTKWLAHGGHATLDLASALAFCAGVTERIRLMTHLLVLPYHNPFAVAKALTTVDVLSEGRLTVVAGTGYLRSEFLAMGVDVETRNARFDEALAVLERLWNAGPEGVTHSGEYYTGLGVAHVPGPVQPGGPPIMIGGNSALARRRAAEHQGWSPLVLEEGTTRSWRTPPLTLERLPERIAEVRAAASKAQGPEASVTIQVQGPTTQVMRGTHSHAEHGEMLARLHEMGVDSVVLHMACTSVDDAVRSLENYAETHFG